ncbi:RING finger protein 10 [Halotydeus destructor]|nr:RING finger protein 10 [Halotydeus destructor]
MDKTISNSTQSLKGSSSSNGSDIGAQKNRSGARRKESSYQKADKKKLSNTSTKQLNGDKRPKPRGYGDRGRGTASGTLDLEWDGDMSSMDTGVAGSGFEKKSRKHNMSHLLNFTLTPRESNPGNEMSRNSHSRHAGSKIHKYSKEQFIQANSQFVVRDGRDYSVHAADPDLLVDWGSIEDVHFNCSANESVCPICLDHPVAGKITKCGHIYCWSCILHYLALGDNKYRKCPICFDMISKQELKSASAVTKPIWRQDDRITLYLMKRKRGSTLTVPVKYSSESREEEWFMNLESNESVSCYQTLLIASASQVLKNVTSRERFELERQLEMDGDTPESCFIEEAIQLLGEREKELDLLVSSNESQSAEIGKEERPRRESSGEEKDNCYYFYQSSDGQHIYLTSVNARMLAKEYGSLENSPLEIEGRVVEIELESMTEEMRKRTKHMHHIPLTCEFKVVELDMKPPLVSQATADVFGDELGHREKNRRRRARNERRHDRNVEREEYKKVYGIYPQQRIVMSDAHFPVYGEAASEGRPSSPFHQSDISNQEDIESNCLLVTDDRPAADPELTKTTHCQLGFSPPEAVGSSFASMLCNGRAQPQQYRSSARPTVPACSQPTREILTVSEDKDEYVSKPLHQYSLCDALAAALTVGGQKRGKKKKRGVQLKVAEDGAAGVS